MNTKYKYNICVTHFIDTPTGEYECTDDVLDSKGEPIWYHCPEEALKMMYKLEEEEEDLNRIYSVVVDYWADPYDV